MAESGPHSAGVEAGSAASPRRSRARRLGCGLILLLWFALLLTPCALFFLAANGEIRLEHGEIPQPHAHPLLLVSLVSEAADRGLRFEASWIAGSSAADGPLCVETAVRFLLWEYSGGNQNVRYCDCYASDPAGGDWQLSATYANSCE